MWNDPHRRTEHKLVMMYQAFDAHALAMAPMRAMAQMTARLLAPAAHLAEEETAHTPLHVFAEATAAALEVIGHTALTHGRPEFGIDQLRIGNADVAVTEIAADRTAFGTLLHFRKDSGVAQPPVLVVAPMSGHFATLLRNTVRTLLPEHDVFITDWHNARDVRLSAGVFDFDAFVDTVIRFIRHIGPGAHVVAVCQPTVAVLAAVSLMSQDNDPAVPRSMTLMAGPIDTRISPTRVNVLAKSHPIEWFDRHLISVVPARHRGGGRRVYPGFVQLSAFMSMNMDRHVRAQFNLMRHRVRRDLASAAAHRKFYDEYFAVMDLPAEFYLQTVARIFQDHDLPLGRLTWNGERVEPRAIRRTFVFTVEGEQDDICAIGQTMAALDLCSGLRPGMKRHHLQTGVGHYGVFSGRRWDREIYPNIREVVQMTAA